MDIRTKVGNRLELTDPFMIASSHWTDNESSFKHLARVEPSAATLKTVSSTKGGDGTSAFGSRERRNLFGTFGAQIGGYTDGPKTVELWNSATALFKSKQARKLLPQSTKLGLSVLYGENYAQLRRDLDLNIIDYVELNWKYTFRDRSLETFGGFLTQDETDLALFLGAFDDKPCIVKLPSEVAQYVATDSLRSILRLLHSKEAVLLTANTGKLCVPPSRLRSDEPLPLDSGVVFGEYLLLQTFTAIRKLDREKRINSQPVPPIIATGGIVDVGAVVDVLAAGADAVQLCSALDLRGVEMVHVLRNQLQSLAAEHETLCAFVSTLRSYPTQWSRTAVASRAYALDDNLAYDVLQKNKSEVEKILTNALRNELGQSDSIASDLESIAAVPSRPTDPLALRIFVPKSNIGAYVIAQTMARRGGLTPIEVEDSQGFKRFLKKTPESWDFAIFPRCVARSIQDDIGATLGRHLFDIPTTVGKSICEIVHDTRIKVEELEEIFYFNGATSQHAVMRYKDYIHPTGLPDTTEIEALKLIPKLNHWESATGILAKPPISRIYKLFCPRDIQPHWGSTWSVPEDLVLLRSSAFAARSTCEEDYKWVLQLISEAHKTIGRSLEERVRELMTTGFLAHCAKLLGLKRGYNGSI